VRRATGDRCDARPRSPILHGAGAIAAPTSPGRSCSLPTVPLLQMCAIVKRFPGVLALDQVDFDVASGEIVALVGENGVSKSTLMKILAGIYRPDAGEIRVGASPAARDRPGAATRPGIAAIHQVLGLIDTLDLAGN